MRRIKNLIPFYFAFFALTSQAQVSEIDSLRNVIAAQREDSLKVNNLISLSSKYLNSNLQEAVRYGSEAQDLAKKIGFQKGEAYAFKAIGLGYYFQANYPEAVIQFQNSLAIFESIQFKVGIANILSNLGATYFNAGEDTKAIDFYLRSLRISEEVNDKLRIGTALNNIGGVYNNKPITVNKALEYFLRALPIFKEINYADGVATASMNAGEIYMKKELYDSAIHYFEASLDIYKESLDATFALTFLGQIYAQQKEYGRAYDYHNKAIKIAEGVDAKFELAQSVVGLAETQRRQGKLRESVASYERAQKLAEEVSARKELKESYEALADLHATLGEFKKAYVYETLLTGIKDSLYNSDNDRKIQQLQFNFDIDKKQSQIDLLTKDNELRELDIQRQKTISIAAGITVVLVLILALGALNRTKYVRRTNKIINEEKERSENLLLNILPAETAKELQKNGHAAPRFYDSVTVLFTDFKGFSAIAGTLSPQDLVSELNEYFIAFDDIVGKFHLEKIKTIGDAYMCAGGIPSVSRSHPQNAVKAALAMQEFMAMKNTERKNKGLIPWELRVGIHTGPIVAGVVGKKKYAYDIWGDTVNIASRMESNGEAGKVNISESTYNLIKAKYKCLHRGKVSAKNIGEVDMYFIEHEIEPQPVK